MMSDANGPPKNDATPPECDGQAQDKNAGSANSSAIGATEDDVLRRPVRSGRGLVLQQPQDIPAAAPAGPRTSRTLEKGLLLLDLFDVEHQQWSLRELREATGESKTTVLRLTKTLEGLGYLARDERSGKLRLGAGIAKLSYVNLSHNELVPVAVPYMRRLSEETNEPVDLAVEVEQDSLMTLYDVTPRFLRQRPSIGRITHPGLTTAAGKIFLAFRPEQTWDEVLAQPVQPLTEQTITDATVLREQLLRARQEGVAFDSAESSVELGGVAVPVFGLDGSVRAVMSVVSAIEQFGPQEMADNADAARQVAADLSEELGAPVERVAFLRNRRS
jgi:DNA-binding IclR family transcriptional regulator